MKKELTSEQERSLILTKYGQLLRICRPFLEADDLELIRAAFELVLKAHSGLYTNSGEPFIVRSLDVAIITAESLGLATTSIVSIMLYDAVIHDKITYSEVEEQFGKDTTLIIKGLDTVSTKINLSKLEENPENYIKFLLTLTSEMRVILTKLAYRLYDMRHIQHETEARQQKILDETQFLYAPIAHRLGLYKLKTEFDEKLLKETQSEVYRMIAKKLNATKAIRDKYIAAFISPLKEKLSQRKLKITIKGRPKSIYSIWKKMQAQNVPFEQVYDLFAIRIIIDSEIRNEKADCWEVYSVVTEKYQPNPMRLRDWISNPKKSGYESLHTTVLGPEHKWIEVQIRTVRMDEIAEKGQAAHWKYKQQGAVNQGLDSWLAQIREELEKTDAKALSEIDQSKVDLYSKEIFIFTPKGDLKKVSRGATVLDFAFSIHSQVGAQCTGALINEKIVPIKYKLQNGDLVKILTSKKQKPKREWLTFVNSPKTKAHIRRALKEIEFENIAVGRDSLMRKFKQQNIEFSDKYLKELLAKFGKFKKEVELYEAVGKEEIDHTKITKFLKEIIETEKTLQQPKEREFEETELKKTGNSDFLILDKSLANANYTFAKCCNPIPGDKVFAFVTVAKGAKIHKTSCPNAADMRARYPYRVLKVKWKSQEGIQANFLANIEVRGADELGTLNKLSKIISYDMKLNMRSATVEKEGNIFKGNFLVYIHNAEKLEILIEKLKNTKGIHEVRRVNSLQ